ncbi:MAG: hypothetical protein WB522_24940, partial [Pseudolabrys sp.]
MAGKDKTEPASRFKQQSKLQSLSAGIVALGLAGTGATTFRSLANHSTPPSLGGFFLESKIMEVEEYNIWPHLPADAFPAIFTRSAIFASVLIAVPVITIGIGLTKPHGEIVDIQKYPWSSMGKIVGMG